MNHISLPEGIPKRESKSVTAGITYQNLQARGRANISRELCFSIILPPIKIICYALPAWPAIS